MATASGTSTNLSPRVECLEQRRLLSLSYVDDPFDFIIDGSNMAGDWYVDVDQGALGTLDTDDTVTWQKGAAGEVSGLTYGTDAFGAIQTAINTAGSGDTINVAAGSYNEALTINKSLTLVGDPGDASEGAGAGAPVIDGTGMFLPGASISGAASQVRIEGLKFEEWFSTLR